MPHAKCEEVYYFNELSEKAKENARSWYRTDYPFDEWWDGVYSNVEDAAGYLGIDIDKKPVTLMNGKTRYDSAIYFSGFSSQGDGARFLGTWRASAMKPGASLAADFATDTELHRIHAELWGVREEYPEAIITSTPSSCRYSHARSTNLEAILGEDIDYNKETHQPIEEILVDFMQWIYRRLEEEYDYLMADMQIDDAILCNEHEFTKEGRPA